MIEIVEEVCCGSQSCNCNRGGHGESSKEISLEWSDIGCDIQSEEDQVDDETPTPNTISDSEGDARAGTRGKQLLLVVYTHTLQQRSTMLRTWTTHQIVDPPTTV